MSMGNPAGGYTQPYGSSSAANMYGGGFGAGAYDPMLGFGQASGMGTAFNYPTRYSADYTRYAQSGQPFNQPVMGYNSYGQIFAQPQRPPPSFGKGGGGFRPQPPSFGGKGGGGFRQQPPAMGGKGGGGFQPGYGGFQPGYGGFQPGYGYQPQFPGMVAGGPGFRELNRRRPERRTNQLGLNNEPSPPLIRSPSVQVPANQTGPVTGGPGATPPPLVGGVPTDFTVGPDSLKPVIFPQIERKFPQVDRNFNPAAGRGPPGDNTDYRPVESNFVGILPNGGVPTDSVGGFGPGQLISQERPLNPNDFQPLVQPGPYAGSNPYTDDMRPTYAGPTNEVGQFGGPGPTDPREQMNYALGRFDSNAPKPMPVSNEPIMSYPGGSRNWQQQFEGRSSYYDGSGPAIEPAPVEANRPVIDENIYNSPFNLLVGQTAPRKPQVMFDNQAFQNFRLGSDFGRMAFQEGGQVPPDANMEMMMAETAQPEMAGEYDRLIQMTMQAILGQVESPDEIIQMFIDEFGVDAFRQLRDAVLKQQVPGAQTEGMVNGNGGGMDDQVMGMIGNQRPVAVSPGEYIVPADVVSGLGDGSSQAGADILDELNQAVRMTRTGTTQQPRPLMETLQQ